MRESDDKNIINKDTLLPIGAISGAIGIIIAVIVWGVSLANKMEYLAKQQDADRANAATQVNTLKTDLYDEISKQSQTNKENFNEIKSDIKDIKKSLEDIQLKR